MDEHPVLGVGGEIVELNRIPQPSDATIVDDAVQEQQNNVTRGIIDGELRIPGSE